MANPKKPAKKPPAKAAPKKAAPKPRNLQDPAVTTGNTGDKLNALPFERGTCVGGAQPRPTPPVDQTDMPGKSWRDGEATNPLGEYAQTVDPLGVYRDNPDLNREPLQNPTTPRNA